MPKRPHITLAESLTDPIVAEHIKRAELSRLYDTGCPGLYLGGPNKLGQHVWWFESKDHGTPAIGALHHIDLEDARLMAAKHGKPSAKAVKIISDISKTVTPSPAYDPEARRLEAMNALVSEMVEARWRDMRPRIASFIRDEISKGIERVLRQRENARPPVGGRALS